MLLIQITIFCTVKLLNQVGQSKGWFCVGSLPHDMIYLFLAVSDQGSQKILIYLSKKLNIMVCESNIHNKSAPHKHNAKKSMLLKEQNKGTIHLQETVVLSCNHLN